MLNKRLFLVAAAAAVLVACGDGGGSSTDSGSGSGGSGGSTPTAGDMNSVYDKLTSGMTIEQVQSIANKSPKTESNLGESGYLYEWTSGVTNDGNYQALIVNFNAARVIKRASVAGMNISERTKNF